MGSVHEDPSHSPARDRQRQVLLQGLGPLRDVRPDLAGRRRAHLLLPRVHLLLLPAQLPRHREAGLLDPGHVLQRGQGPHSTAPHAAQVAGGRGQDHSLLLDPRSDPDLLPRAPAQVQNLRGETREQPADLRRASISFLRRIRLY